LALLGDEPLQIFFGLCASACARCGREFGAEFPDLVVDGEHGTDRRCPAGTSSTRDHRNSGVAAVIHDIHGRRANYPSMPAETGFDPGVVD
jgi:hypothetical protein